MAPVTRNRSADLLTPAGLAATLKILFFRLVNLGREISGEQKKADRNLMRSESYLDQALAKAFWAALMVTGNAARAEEAITESIRSSKSEDLTTDNFFLCVITSSVQTSRNLADEQDREGDLTVSILPPELQCVLQLPLMLRHAFVLQILLGLPKHTCMSLLQADAYVLRDTTGRAVQALAVLYRSVASNALRVGYGTV